MENLQRMKFLLIWFSPVAFYCFSEKSKYSLQHSGLEYTTWILSIWVRDQSLQPHGGERKMIVLCILIWTFFLPSTVVYTYRFWSELQQALQEFNLHLNKILTCYSCPQTVQLCHSLSNLLTTFIVLRLCPEFVRWTTHICKMCLSFVSIYFDQSS